MGERRTTDVRIDEETRSGAPTTILVATEYSRNFGAGLYLAHVMPVSSFHSDFGPADEMDGGDTLTIYEEDAEHARYLLDKQVEQLEEEGVAVEKADLRTGEPAAGVVGFAEEVGTDLVAVGSRGTGTFKRAPMGSVSESVVRHAHCPVLVVREQECTDDGKRA